MQSEAFQIRRATLEDIQALCQLWKEAQLPAIELEKRFTEFQIIHNAKSELVGAIGLHMVNHQGLIHSEVYSHPEVEDLARPLVWERLERLAVNHGLNRFWTREESPFWVHYAGMKQAAEDDLKQMPVDFGLPQGRWLTLMLREAHYSAVKIDQELMLFKQAQEETLDRIQRQTLWWKRLAMVVVALFFICCAVGCLYLLKMRNMGPR